jgi:hypothetical protein
VQTIPHLLDVGRAGEGRTEIGIGCRKDLQPVESKDAAGDVLSICALLHCLLDAPDQTLLDEGPVLPRHTDLLDKLSAVQRKVEIGADDLVAIDCMFASLRVEYELFDGV